jgi:SAM-dependent methyltransferase
MDIPKYRQRAYNSYLTTQVRPDAEAILETVRVRMPHLRRLIKRWVPADRDIAILDVGCGHGALLYALLEAGYRNLSGVDGSAEQVAAAQRLGLPQVRQGDLLTALASTSTASLDLVVAFDVLEHLFKDEVVQFMDHFRRILRPRGRLLIHVPNGEGILGGRMRYADITHELAFTYQSLLQLGMLSGFSQFHFEEDVPAVHGVMSALRWALWRVLRLPFRLVYVAETGDLGRNPLLSQNMFAVLIRGDGSY